MVNIIRRNYKIIVLSASFLLFDILLSARFILGLNFPFYDDFMARRNTKDGTQMTVSGKVISVDGDVVSLINSVGQTKEYTLSEQTAYFRAKIVNDKEFLRDMKRIEQTMPQKGELIFLNLFDENGKGHFIVGAVFLPEE